jgi:phosphonate transport system substrate-binding protein
VGQTQEKVRAETLSLGIVFQGPREPIEEHFRDLVGYVARKLSSTPDIKGRVVVAPTALQLAKLLEEKQVDFYMESPYPTYLINRQGAATLLLRRWKGGMAEYRSILFTNKDSGITRLEDLRGKIVAFEDPGSTSGYFLPKLFLLKKGFRLTEKPGLEAKVSLKEIGYIFIYSAENIASLVRSKKVAAGAISNDDYDGLGKQVIADISVLGETEKLPRHLVSIRKDLRPAVTKRLKEILLSMHQDDEGRKILQQTDNTTKFDSLPGGEEMVRRRLVELFRPREKK